jgi:phosphoribosylformylglycinamidine synthase
MPEYQVLVTVLPRPELLDPEGDTITQAIHRIGEPRVKTVRAGRAFELHIQAPTPEEASAIAHPGPKAPPQSRSGGSRYSYSHDLSKRSIDLSHSPQ